MDTRLRAGGVDLRSGISIGTGGGQIAGSRSYVDVAHIVERVSSQPRGQSACSGQVYGVTGAEERDEARVGQDGWGSNRNCRSASGRDDRIKQIGIRRSGSVGPATMQPAGRQAEDVVPSPGHHYAWGQRGEVEWHI